MRLTRFLAACAAATVIGAAPGALAQTMVRVHTSLGPIDIQLLDAEAPRTVANFLAYARAGDYDDTFVHRLVRDFVFQGGGRRWREGGRIAEVPARDPVANEFSADRSNVRGTVAMAKVGGNPDSATSQWFVNLADNSGPCPGTGQAQGLDCQNGGFTVFGRVTPASLAAAGERIAALQILNASSSANPGSPYGTLPVTGWTSGTVRRSQVVIISKVTEFAAAPSDAERIFNWLEAAFPQYLGSEGEAAIVEGYTVRRYAGRDAAVGVKDGNVYYLVPSVAGEIRLAGSIAELLPRAIEAGY